MFYLKEKIPFYYIFLKFKFSLIPYNIIINNYIFIYNNLVKYLFKYGFLLNFYLKKNFFLNKNFFLLLVNFKKNFFINYYLINLLSLKLKEFKFLNFNLNVELKKKLIVFGFFNIPIFNLFIKKTDFNKTIVLYTIFIKNLIENNIIILLYNLIYKSNFYIFNSILINNNFFFFFLKKIFLIFRKKFFIINLLNKDFKYFNFNLKKSKKNNKKLKINYLKKKYYKKIFIINKLLFFSKYNSILIINNLIENLIFNIKKIFFIKKKFKNYILNFCKNIFFFFQKTNNYLFLFDIYGKISYYYIIIINKNNNFKYITFKIEYNIFSYFFFLKINIKFSFIKNIFLYNKNIFYNKLGSYVFYLNRIISILNKIFFFYNFNLNEYIFIYKIYFINKFYSEFNDYIDLIINFYLNNENLNKNYCSLLINYSKFYLIYKLYNLIFLWFINNFNNEKDLFGLKKKLLFIIIFLMKYKFSINLFWLLYIIYIEFFYLFIFYINISYIYIYIIEKIFVFLSKYNFYLIKSILNFRPINFKFLEKKINILNFFIKKKLIILLIYNNNRIYKILKKNLKFFYNFSNIFLLNLIEKKIYNIFNKIKFNVLYFLFLNNFKYILFSEFYLIYFFDIFINIIKIKSENLILKRNRILLLYEFYKILNIFVDIKEFGRFSSYGRAIDL